MMEPEIRAFTIQRLGDWSRLCGLPEAEIITRTDDLLDAPEDDFDRLVTSWVLRLGVDPADHADRRTLLDVWVPGMPKGQPRPRAFARGGHARVYDPGTAEGWKAQVALSLRPHLPQEPLSGPLMLRLEFVLLRPQAHFTAGRRDRGLKAHAPQWHVAKPDIDNLVKAVLDAMTTLGFWRDDSVIAAMATAKRWGQQPGCRIGIWRLGQD